MFTSQHALYDNELLYNSLLMKTISSEMGLLEGMPMNQIPTHNIELLRQGQYHFAGQLVAWSIANGGPGLVSLSNQCVNLSMTFLLLLSIYLPKRFAALYWRQFLQIFTLADKSIAQLAQVIQSNSLQSFSFL